MHEGPMERSTGRTDRMIIPNPKQSSAVPVVTAAKAQVGLLRTSYKLVIPLAPTNSNVSRANQQLRTII
jgi:hypothetical protein